MSRNYDSHRDSYRPRDFDRSRRDPRNQNQRDQRREYVPQQPPMMPQPNHQQQQLQQKGKIQEQSDILRSLIEAKGKLNDLVLLSAQRKALVQLFSGSSHESWFLMELIETFPILVTRRAGANFIYSINHKMREPFQPWIHALLDNLPYLMEFNNGAMIYYDLIPFLDKDDLKKIATYSWTIYQEKYSENHMILYAKLIRLFKDEPEIIEPLFDVEWNELKYHQEMVVNLISNFPSQIDNLYAKYSNAIAGMTQSVDFVHTICAFLEFGSLSVREQIYGAMMSSINDLVMRDPSWNVLSMMIIVGTNEKRKNIGDALFQVIVNNPVLPQHFDILLTRLLLAFQLSDRLAYINNLEPYIEKLMKPKFIELLKYTYCLLNE